MQKDQKNKKEWKSISVLFEAMNESLEYCILRNTEDVTIDFSPEIHGDIDIIVRDQKAAVLLMHAKKVHKKAYRVYYEVPVAGGVVPFDIRFVGDNYYCKKWESDVLDTRVLVERGGMKYYMMCPEQQYFTLLYHVYLQKQSVSLDYPAKLTEYARLASVSYIDDVNVVMPQLVKYMQDRNYRYVLPKDLDVGINWKNMRYLKNYRSIRCSEQLSAARNILRVERMYGKIVKKAKYTAKQFIMNCLDVFDKKFLHGRLQRKLSRIDARHEFLRYGESYFIKNENAHVGRTKVLRVPVKDLITMQVYFPMRFRSWVMAVHLLYLEYLDGKNNIGLKLERKLLQKQYGEEKLAEYDNKIKHIRSTNWKDVEPIEVDRDLRLIDGALRLAIAYYNQQDFIFVRCADYSVNQYVYGRDYLWSLGFDAKELQLVEKKVEEILEESRYLNTCIIWPPAREMYDELQGALTSYEPENISIRDYWDTTMSYEEIKGFIEMGYKKDDAMDWALQMKSKFMFKASQIDDDVYPVRFVRLRMVNPDYVVKPTSGQPYSQESLRCKETLREIFKHQVKYYERDVVIHISDNYLQSNYIWLLAHVDRDLSELFKALEDAGLSYKAVDSNNRQMSNNNAVFSFGENQTITIRGAKKSVVTVKEIVIAFAQNHFKGEWLVVEEREKGCDVLLENECILRIRIEADGE